MSLSKSARRAPPGSRRTMMPYREMDDQRSELAATNRTLEARVAEQVQELERLGRLRRFLSPRLAQLLVSAEGEALLESHRRRIAVVGCQLSGFTALSETAAPEEALGVLRGYHALVGAAIDRFEGTLGSLDGDRLTVLFNDPLPVDDPAGQAVAMALAVRELLPEAVAAWRRQGHQLDVGLGVALGYATLGLVRVGGRTEYSAVGPVVDVAARLAAEARGGRVLVTHWVQAAVEEHVESTRLGELRLGGMVRPVVAYDVTPAQSGKPRSPEPSPCERSGPLTDREWDVVDLIVQGHTNRQIADALVIAEGTAVRHVANILSKLGLRSRGQVAVWAIQRGLASACLDEE
jgi:class 3 adenylate cyclase/DNA-binding CsgD family transcriptional regulator